MTAHAFCRLDFANVLRFQYAFVSSRMDVHARESLVGSGTRPAGGISGLDLPGDHSHEDPVLADEMMEKRRPNMRSDKASHGNADQPVN
jgi:hypothetical protein